MCFVLFDLSALQPSTQHPAPRYQLLSQHKMVTAPEIELAHSGSCQKGKSLSSLKVSYQEKPPESRFMSYTATLASMFLATSGQGGFLDANCETPC